MISCTEFIYAYSEIFRYLEKKGSKQDVIDYWNYISDTASMPTLGRLMRERGLRGCYDYWSVALNEEAADFTMTLDEENNIFTLDMHWCPSKGRIVERKDAAAYPDYCGHCNVLYRRVAEACGFDFEYDMTHIDRAACKLTIRDRRKQA